MQCWSGSLFGGGGGKKTGGGGLGAGGAVFIDGGALTAVNSTFTGNQAQGGAADPSTAMPPSGIDGAGLGGALFNLNGSATLTNCTLTQNLEPDAGSLSNSLTDGAVYQLGYAGGSAQLTLANDILYGNGAVHDLVTNVMASGTSVLTAAIESDVKSFLNLAPPGASPNFVNLDPQFTIPASTYGGLTPTYAIGSSAVAVQGDRATCAGGAGGIDQRGYLRPTTTCSLGSYDPNATKPAPPTADMGATAPGDGAQATGCSLWPTAPVAAALPQVALLLAAALVAAGRRWRTRGGS
jgi:hypothetical protein